MFLFGLVVPVGLGLAVFGLLRLRRAAKPNLWATILPAVLGWWLGLYLLFQGSGGDFSWGRLILAAIVPAGIIGFITEAKQADQ
jgi:hypothetical protein